MKSLVTVLALAAMLVAPPAMAKNMCVMSRDIVSTHSDDGKLLTFKMRDGSVLVNHLHGVCTDLRFEGFAWKVPGTEDICENQQSLTVLRSGQTCLLGKFEETKPKRVSP